MSTTDDTTLRLTDTSAAGAPTSLWLISSGLGAAPPLRLFQGDKVLLGRGGKAVAVSVSDDNGPPVTSEPVKGVLFGPGLCGVLETVRRLASDSLPVVIVGNGADDGANSGVPPTPASD